ncbi:putative disease resistance protein RGA3 [Humulus lupulus]|uniref:putative disease resistance protein RGA3 n=1 Tax=Humulus lupulus TaxID=3486 RepID=UPI002B413BCC|nr:putative disease resistance protein RGA3 [Humulus lupulus]XP_062078783.1 putative disease resistance protein RGA3 [Humulus lupulus]
MAEALIVSAVTKQLVDLTFQRTREELSLVQNVDKDLAKLKSNLEAIQVVLEDAETRQLADQSVRNWLDKLKDVTFDMDNVLNEWSSAILMLKIQREGQTVPIGTKKKVCFSIPPAFSCFKSKVDRIALRHDIAHKIKDLNEKLDAIAVEKDRYKLATTTIERAIERPRTTSLVDETEIHGRDNDVNMLLSKLLCEENTNTSRGLEVIPIVGMGGLGKTTLAQLVYKHENVLTHFDKKIWVCVSDPFDEINVAKAIIAEIEGNSPNVNELETLAQKIHKYVKGKRFLLVLDDVWTKDKRKWENLKQPLQSGGKGSKVVVTTRNEEVAIMMRASNNIIYMELLPEEFCWVIFKQHAFSERREEEWKHLEEIGRNIARKSKGLPLVAKTLGSLMRFKKTKTQWEEVLHNELWKTKDVEEIFTPFLVSYFDLSAIERCCFSYCAVFPKDHDIYKDVLIEIWMSQGYLGHDGQNAENEGYQCFENLCMRSFFQNLIKDDLDGGIRSCKMHDIVHDFAQFLVKKECITMEVFPVEKNLTIDEKSRHVTMYQIGEELEAPNYSKSNEKNIRSLFIVSGPSLNVDGLFFSHSSAFSQLMCLRTLSLINLCHLGILEDNIGKLIHLRYLNLQGNYNLKGLPESICDLCNLQTLNLSGCRSIKRLPEGMGKLINLKHLYIVGCGLEGLPRGIGRLSSLRRLDWLVVSEPKQMYSDIGDLENLIKNLRREYICDIKGCRYLGSMFEKKKISFKNIGVSKDNRLNLDFGVLEKMSEVEDDSGILEALEPHRNLRSLIIKNYIGPCMSPSWMLSLTHLQRVQLWNCDSCEISPSLQELQFLEHLEIRWMKSLKKVGVEFMKKAKRDKEDDVGSTSRLNSPNLVNSSFPKLKSLLFDSLPQWEKWEGSMAEAEKHFRVMPSLTVLKILNCPRLETLPDLLRTMVALKELSLGSSMILEECCTRRTGKEWAKISHIPNIHVNYNYVQKDGQLYSQSRKLNPKHK